MSSSNGGRGLPSIDSSLGPRQSNDKNTERSLRNLPGRSSSPQRSNNTFQTTPRGRLPHQQESLGKSRRRPSIHNRTSRSLSSGIEDVDPSRNWNFEGGRPKRERTVSERSNSRRLLQRTSINSSGELIPFQRAPRDGSYESRLPVRKKSTTQNLTGQNTLYSMADHEERLATRLHKSPQSTEEQSSNSVIGNADKSQSLSFDERKKQHSKAKISSKSTDSRREGSRVTRKLSSQEVRDGIIKSPPESALIGCTQSDVTSRGLPSPRKKEQSTDNKSEQNVPAGILVSGLEENREILNNVEEPSLKPDASSSQSVGSSSEPHIDNVFDEGPVTLAHNVHVTSPSAEFKAASQSSSTVTNSANRGCQNVNLSLVYSNESDVRVNEQLSGSPQPNSVVRQRINSAGTVDTGQIHSTQVSVLPSVLSTRRSSRGAQNASLRDDQVSTGDQTATQNSSLNEKGSVNQQQPSLSVNNSVSPRSTLVQPPIGGSTPSAGSTLQQARLNRFGRRIRMPLSDSGVAGESNQSDEEEARTVAEPSGEERFEGTNHQRYRFFSLSRDRSGTEQLIQIPLTPNRDLLYGHPTSPPLHRRHHRTHFGSGTSNLPQSTEEQGASSSIQNSISSSNSNDDFSLPEDLFRTASGTMANFSPLLHSVPVLDSSSSSQPRRRLHEVGSPSSITSLDSSSASESYSPRQLHLQSSTQSLNSVADIERSSDYDQDNLTFSVEEGRLSRDARRRYQGDRSDAIPRLLSQRGRQPQRELFRGAEIMEDVFGSSQDGAYQRSSSELPLRDATLELQIPLLSSPLFSPLGIAPGMLLSLLIRTRREFGQEFMELLLENMMLNVLAHHLFGGDLGVNELDAITGAPPPATQDIIDSLNEIPALESHIEKEMKCAICHSEYELYETLAELPCQHFFHPTCVAIWLKKSGTCPVCRFQLLPSAR